MGWESYGPGRHAVRVTPGGSGCFDKSRLKIILWNICQCVAVAVRLKPSRLLHCEAAHQGSQRLWTKGDDTSARRDCLKGYFYTVPDETAGSPIRTLFTCKFWTSSKHELCEAGTTCAAPLSITYFSKTIKKHKQSKNSFASLCKETGFTCLTLLRMTEGSLTLSCSVSFREAGKPIR